MGGTTYFIKCPHCGKIYEIDYGATALYNPISLFVSSMENNGKPLLDYLVRSKKIKEKTYELAHNGYCLDFDFQHQLYYCKKCKKIYVKFFYHLYKTDNLGNQSDYFPDYRCSKCHRQLNPIAENECHEIEVNCKCGETFNLDIDKCEIAEEWS